MSKSSKRTTVNLTPVAQEIIDEEGYIGLNRILLAGLVLYSLASAGAKIAAIKAANGSIEISEVSNKLYKKG